MRLTENQQLVIDMHQQHGLPIEDAYFSVWEFIRDKKQKYGFDFPWDEAEANKELGSLEFFLSILALQAGTIISLEPGETTTNATELIQSYISLAQELFPNGVGSNISQFIGMFNQHFTQYQHEFSRKMQPESLRKGFVTCSSAALLIGVMWEKEFGTEPYFLLGANYATSPKAHAAVVLPLIPLDEKEMQNAVINALHNQKEDGVCILDFTIEKGKTATVMDSEAVIEEPHLRLTPRGELNKNLVLVKGNHHFANNRLQYLVEEK